MKTLIFNEPEKLYFTSDTHFGHENIIKYCNRPFKDVGHMDKTIMENWNSTVKEDDTIFILGDFCWRFGDKQILWYLDHLAGHKILILGNHDKNEKVFINHGVTVYDGFINLRVKDSDAQEGYQRITTCHYPMLSWYQSHRGSWQFFGHMHNQTLKPLPENIDNPDVADFMKQEFHYIESIKPTQYDCGVDGNNFTPGSYLQIKKFILKHLENSK